MTETLMLEMTGLARETTILPGGTIATETERGTSGLALPLIGTIASRPIEGRPAARLERISCATRLLTPTLVRSRLLISR